MNSLQGTQYAPNRRRSMARHRHWAVALAAAAQQEQQLDAYSAYNTELMVRAPHVRLLIGADPYDHGWLQQPCGEKLIRSAEQLPKLGLDGRLPMPATGPETVAASPRHGSFQPAEWTIQHLPR